MCWTAWFFFPEAERNLVDGNTTNNNLREGIQIKAPTGGVGLNDLFNNTANRNDRNGILNNGNGLCPIMGANKNTAKNNMLNDFVGCPP